MVEDLWNKLHLEPPPTNTSKCKAKHIDVKQLHSSLASAVEFFKNQQQLTKEAALLSRLLYRTKQILRSAKDLKPLQKLNRALLNYLEMDIESTLRSFLTMVPAIYKPNQTYMPTKCLLHYVLVRLQGLSKLLWRILETGKIAAHLAHQRIVLGHYWRFAIVFLALASRIFAITKTMIKYVCSLYADLKPFVNKLSTANSTGWLPDQYRLPDELNVWLNIDWLELERVVIEIPDEPDTISYFNLIDSDDENVEISDEYILIKDDSVFMIDDDDNTESPVEVEQYRKKKTGDVKNDILEVFENMQSEDVGEADDCVVLQSPKKRPQKRKFPQMNKKKKKRYYN